MRHWGWLSWIAVGAGLAAPACDGTLTCTLKACGGGLDELALVDEAGSPAAARGEYRSQDAADLPRPMPFDCSPLNPDAGPRPLCTDGVLLLGVLDIQPQTVVEVRFELSDGSSSEWQALDSAITKHTDPDFNGPGCSCTWYTATAAPLLVPPEARLEAR